MERLIKYLEERRNFVNNALNTLLPKVDLPPATLHEAMRYSVLGSGKRVRPLLALMCGEIFRSDYREILPAACALELVHCYSLVHDDLPAMDNDDLRRGRLTCHKAYNEATAILTGNALLTLAFEIIAANYAPNIALSIIEMLTKAAGHLGLVGGQMLDLEGEKQHFSADEIEAMYYGKTGILIASACRIGALLNGGEGSKLDAIENYGKEIGLLFQITDDLLDLSSTPENLGKAVGKDARTGKATLVGIYGRDKIEAKMKTIAAQAKNQLKSFGAEALMPRLFVDYILMREK